MSDTRSSNGPVPDPGSAPTRTRARPERHHELAPSGKGHALRIWGEIDDLWTADDVASRLRVSTTTAYELLTRLDGVVRVGRSVRVPRSVIESYIHQGGDQQCNGVPEPDSSAADACGSATFRTRAESGSGRARTRYPPAGPHPAA